MILQDKQDVVDKLCDGKIIAIFQNHSEWGPRAQGNRSMLFDPRIPDGKDIVNNVKKREWYRPLSGTIMLEYANDYFEMLTIKESPYMSFAIKAKQKAIETVPSIVHKDGTSRIQTVTEKQNKNYYELIKSFYERTNVPILLNTSFNLAGEPIVETFEHAIKTINNCNIDYLYLPHGKIQYEYTECSHCGHIEL